MAHTNAGSETAAPVVPVTTIPVQVASELLKGEYRYLDVRTHEEFAKGHVEGAINIPYMYKEDTGMTKNIKFVEEVSKEFSKDDHIIVGCQSGRRSLMAANDLVAVEFKGIKDMGGGITAWIQSGFQTTSNL